MAGKKGDDMPDKATAAFVTDAMIDAAASVVECYVDMDPAAVRAMAAEVLRAAIVAQASPCGNPAPSSIAECN